MPPIAVPGEAGRPAPRPITWPPPLSGGLAARGERAIRPSGRAALRAGGGATPAAPSPPVRTRNSRHLDSWLDAPSLPSQGESPYGFLPLRWHLVVSRTSYNRSPDNRSSLSAHMGPATWKTGPI